MPKVSIIIRARNEEAWIGHCLKAVFSQDFRDFEVILVDNQSDDYTVEVARRFPIGRVVRLEQYRPGLALNLGIRQSSGEYLACLSAHCIPQTAGWLSQLLSNFDGREPVAGVYGRQLPMPFSTPSDKRDLLITFGLDRRVQVKDYFFHNANSLIARAVWERIPFDESVSNVEDRLWARAAVEAGYRLVYDPEAAVYHHHGIHQGEDPQRARSVVSVIEQFEGGEALAGLPDTFKPEQCFVAAVLPVLGEVKQIAGRNLLADLLERLGRARYVRSVYVLSENAAAEALAAQAGASFLPRPPELLSGERSLEDVLQYALTEIERGGVFPDAVLYANYLYPFRPEDLFDELIRDLRYKGLEAVFPGRTDYLTHWVRDGAGNFEPMGDRLMPRERKQPLYRALYGLGCVSAAPLVRSGRLVGGRVGIVPVEDDLYALKCADPKSERLVALLLGGGLREA